MTETSRPQTRSNGKAAEQSEQMAEEQAHVQERRAAVRSFISGYVDAYALLSFGVYASFMTGNTTSGGVHAGQLKAALAGHSLLPIPFFMLGIFSGTFTMQVDRLRALSRLSIVIACLLIFDVIVTHVGWPGWLSIMVLSFAMGLTNTTVTRVGAQSVSLGFMTGDLNNLARQLAEGIGRKPIDQAQGAWDTRLHRIRVLAALWISFFIGAVSGAVVSRHLGVGMLSLPAMALFVLAYFERTTAVPS
jgi:uncharacterized membrane protein YoaK (UPF0700 family)